MTEEEREEKERKKEWVKARYNCTIGAVFEQLFAVVDSDVNTFNKLTRKAVYECHRVESDPNVFLVLPIEVNGQRSGPNVRFSRHGNSVQIEPVDNEKFTVVSRWCEDSLECKLLFNDDPEHELLLSEISQKAIGKLLFNGAVYPEPMGGG